MDEKDRNRQGERSSTGNTEARTAAVADQRSSFYERAARRVGERGQPSRGPGANDQGPFQGEWRQPRDRERDRDYEQQQRSRAAYEMSRAGWGGSFGASGGFGQGGYGSYGAPQSAADPWSPATQPGRESPGAGGPGGNPGYGERYDQGQASGYQPGGGAQPQPHAGGQTPFGRGEAAWGRQFGGEPRDRDRDGDRTRERRSRWQREAITAGEIMTSGPRAATRESTLQEIAHIMKDENCGVVPVVDGERRLIGVVTDRDLVVRAAAENKPFAETRAGEVMTDDVEAVTPDEEINDVIELMGKKQVRRVPVVDKDDRLLGIISMGDIANRADYDEELQAALERVSSKRSFWSRLWT